MSPLAGSRGRWVTGRYDEGGNGDWKEWKRLLVEQIRELRADVKELEKQNAKQWTQLIVLKTKLGVYTVILAAASSAAVNYFVKVFSGHS